MDNWLSEHLVCPRDLSHLRLHGETLECDRHHSYPYVQGVPIMLTPDLSPTQPAFWDVLRSPQALRTALGDAAEDAAEDAAPETGAVDPFVQGAVAATCGYLYRPAAGRLTRYPIPELRLPRSSGEYLLDVGCNWGRWSISASRRGYNAVGIEPNLSAVLAARRVARQLGAGCTFVVGDGRTLPFQTEAFDAVFSYSVIQHFAKADAKRTFGQIGRVLKRGATCLIQMPNKLGVRSLYHQLRARFRRQGTFDVRYWSPDELRRAVGESIGPVSLAVDGYFGLGVQPSDLDLLPPRFRLIVRASERLRALSRRRRLTWLTYLADSLYVQARRA